LFLLSQYGKSPWDGRKEAAVYGRGGPGKNKGRALTKKVTVTHRQETKKGGVPLFNNLVQLEREESKSLLFAAS